MMSIKNISSKIILYALIFLIILSPFLVYKYVDYFRANQELWVKLISFFILFLVLAKIIRGESIALSRDQLSLLLIIFFLYLSLSLLYSSSRLLSLKFLFLFFCYISLSLLAINLTVNNKNELIIKIFIISAFLISSYTILHYYGLIRYFAEFGPIFSPIGQKNWTSNFLALVLPSTFAFYLLEEAENKFKRYFYAITTIIIYTTILICQSRGIWISILLTLPLAFLLIKKAKLTPIFIKNRKNLRYLLLILIVITVIYSTENPLNKSPLTIPERAFSVFEREDASINMRLIMLGSSLKMIQARPLGGFGLGTFNLNYPPCQALYLQEKPGMIKYLSDQNVLEAHNEYAQFAAEIGLAGLLLFLIIILFLYKQSRDYLRAKEIEPEKKMIKLGWFLGLNIFLIHCLFTFPFHVPFLGASFFLWLGLANSSPLDNKEDKKEVAPDLVIHLDLRKTVKTFSLAGLTLILVVSAYLFVIEPYLATVYSFRGQVATLVDKDLDQAINYFEKAVSLDPNNGRIWLHLGATYFNANFPEEALVALEQAKKYYSDKNIYRNMALGYSQLGKKEEAITRLEKALYLYPHYIRAYHDLASLYVDEGEYQKAIEQWERAIKLGLDFEEKPIFLYYIGIAWQRMGESEQAYNYFLKALIEAPDGSPLKEEIEEEIQKIDVK